MATNSALEKTGNHRRSKTKERVIEVEGTDNRAREFGQHLRRIRTEVFDESLREFAARTGLSASYIGKLENAEVGAPKRSTVSELAERLAMKPDGLLLKAGYVPESQARDEDDEYLLMLLGTLTPEQKAAVKSYIQHVKDYEIVQTRPDRPSAIQVAR